MDPSIEERNFDLLRRRHPAAFRTVSRAVPSEARSAHEQAPDSGLLQSRVAEQPVTVIFGFGDGRLVEGVLELAPEHARIVVCVLDPGRLAAALSSRDLNFVLDDPRVELLAGSLAEITAAMPRPERDEIEVLTVPSLSSCAHPDFAPLVAMGEELSAQARSSRRQRPYVLDNLSRNLDTVLCAPGWADLADRLRGRPVLLVAPGPSLGLARETLRVRPLPLLVTVDTAIRTLEDWRVRYDLSFTLDPTPGNREKFRGVKLRAPLAFFGSARPEAVSASRNPIYVCEQGGLLDECHPWFGSRGRALPVGSVLYAALDALLRAGAGPVGLLGADLAVDRDAHHVEGAQRTGGEPARREVPARGGGTVLTTESLWRHWRRLCRLIRSAPVDSVVDLTARGASLDPAPRLDLDEWLASLRAHDLDVGLDPPATAEAAPSGAREAALKAIARARERATIR